MLNFYPRSPCGERPAFDVLAVSALLISIHALLAESDEISGDVPNAETVISIHALLAESDVPHYAGLVADLHFYPRSPCGERPVFGTSYAGYYRISIHALLAESDEQSRGLSTRVSIFLSTLSLRRATSALAGAVPAPGHFYPRSPCGERPRERASIEPVFGHFYPRSPCGERPS